MVLMLKMSRECQTIQGIRQPRHSLLGFLSSTGNSTYETRQGRILATGHAPLHSIEGQDVSLRIRKTSREEDDAGCGDQKPQVGRCVSEVNIEDILKIGITVEQKRVHLSWINTLCPVCIDYSWDMWRCCPTLTKLEDTRDITWREVIQDYLLSFKGLGKNEEKARDRKCL